MNPEVKQLWVSALRDPEVRQGKACLKNGNKFCCLGLLTELYRVSPDNSSKLNWNSVTKEPMEAFNGSAVSLPKIVSEWADLNARTKIDVDRGQSLKYNVGSKVFLEDLNDAGAPFSEIADLIEKQL